MAAYRPRPSNRRNRAETLGMTVSRLTKPIFGKRGLADGTVAKEWGQIVGPIIAKHSRPDRITYANRERHSGLLHLRVDHSAMATELQHLEPQLLERINGYFGFKAVAKMRYIHGPLADVPAANTSAAPRSAPPQNPIVAQEVTTIADPELREALNRLGNAVYQDDTDFK